LVLSVLSSKRNERLPCSQSPDFRQECGGIESCHAGRHSASFSWAPGRTNQPMNQSTPNNSVSVPPPATPLLSVASCLQRCEKVPPTVLLAGSACSPGSISLLVEFPNAYFHLCAAVECSRVRARILSDSSAQPPPWPRPCVVTVVCEADPKHKQKQQRQKPNFRCRADQQRESNHAAPRAPGSAAVRCDLGSARRASAQCRTPL
jgi:hypothetical protein